MSYQNNAYKDMESDRLPLMPGADNAAFQQERPVRDRPWSITFFLFVALTLVGGVFSIVLRNPVAMTALADPEYLSDPHNCPAQEWSLGVTRRNVNDLDVSSAAVESFVMFSVWSMLATVIVSILLGFFTLWLNRAHPKALVMTAIAVNIIICVLMGAAMIKVFLPGALMCFLSAALLSTLAFWYRESLELCASLIKVAGEGISSNMSLIGMASIMEICNIVLVVPVVVFCVFAFQNGHVAPQEAVVYDAAAHVCRSTLQSMEGLPVACCTWQPATWSVMYIGLAFFVMTWMLMILLQIRLFTVSGTIAQWYFNPNGVSSSTRIMTSLKHAVGPQFGSVCESGLILTVVQMVRQSAQEQQRDGNGGCAVVMACLAQCIADIIEKLTKFTTITMSITGSSFMDSATTTYELLTRNMLSTATVWWLPNMVLGTLGMMIPLVWSVLVGLASYAHWAASPATAEMAGAGAAFLGIFAFITGLVILMYELRPVRG